MPSKVSVTFAWSQNSRSIISFEVSAAISGFLVESLIFRRLAKPPRVAGLPNSIRSYLMFNYEETLQAMRSQRASMQQELNRLDRAISALQAVAGRPAPARSTSKGSARNRRRAVVGTQAKNKQPKKALKASPKISAQGLRNISEAQKRRWAKVRAAKAKAKSATGRKSSETQASS
jgi:hypothetical protein